MRYTGLLYVPVLLLVLTGLVSVPVQAREGRNMALVLITASDYPLEKLSASEVRRLFINEPVVLKQQKITPLINTSDELQYEIFLQKVVYMSERYYERMLISKTFRRGRARPERFSDNNELVNALVSISGSVSVMWRETAEKEKRIRIVQTLWKKQH
ncbi:hypothetical protein MNBD_GAMMA11-2130 [hydrothermal vent metagenome]|uniref:Uncharacterized protein n=1 Tax=hydrothermal vent metagenome TaxID=652676 RepID=A0A3B0Y9X5_9ZZZZ